MYLVYWPFGFLLTEFPFIAFVYFSTQVSLSVLFIWMITLSGLRVACLISGLSLSLGLGFPPTRALPLTHTCYLV